MNNQIAPLRVEQIKTWLDRNKEYLSHALITEKTEITISMKGPLVKVKVTQFPDNE